MKKLTLIAILIMVFTSTAFAHYGSLGLYTSEVADDCDFAPMQFAPFDVYIMYIRSDGGPDGISAFEFMLFKNSASIVFQAPEWAQQDWITEGDIESGISVGVGDCYGAGIAVLYLGKVPMFSLIPTLPPDTYIKVMADPGAQKPGIWVSECPDPKPIHMVLGGWFLFAEGACNTSTESKSWSAIKSMYKE